VSSSNGSVIGDMSKYVLSTDVSICVTNKDCVDSSLDVGGINVETNVRFEPKAVAVLTKLGLLTDITTVKSKAFAALLQQARLRCPIFTKCFSYFKSLRRYLI
jgi:hypothetical protein